MSKGSERVKAWRAERVAEGYKVKSLLLPPDALKAIVRAAKRLDVTHAEAVTIAVKELASKRN